MEAYIESREIGYPLKPDLGIKLSDLGKKVLEQINLGKVKSK